ncbi:MAG: hypothetical protein M3P39_00615 [Actinomycetota bacterium]|nr:hypothetical protein [Actinomycetota bacterium]
MPRHTHLRPRGKHDREHTRLQRERYERRRWRQVEQWQDRSRTAGLHPETIRRERPAGLWWPFDLEPGRFARNPFTCCSCDLCSVPAHERRAERRRAERRWRAEAQRDDASPTGSGHRPRTSACTSR